MLQLEPQFKPEAGHVDLSLNDPDPWGYPEGFGIANGTFAHIGDEVCGPVIFFFTVVPDAPIPESPAHGHASDNWRISMRGVLPMGKERYHPGDFRFQEGWKPYGSDSMSTGPEGGWAALVFGDRRGTKIRPVREGDGPFPDERGICEWANLRGDQVSDDPAEGAGPAGLVTTLGAISGYRVNGSFNATDGWPEVAPGVRAVGALMGDAVRGPVMFLEHAQPGATVTPASASGTEIIRLVVDGAALVGDATYGAGDIRIQDADAPCEAVVAGPDGLKEVVMYGDRRSIVGGAAADWAVSLVDDMRSRLPVVTS